MGEISYLNLNVHHVEKESPIIVEFLVSADNRHNASVSEMRIVQSRREKRGDELMEED